MTTRFDLVAAAATPSKRRGILGVDDDVEDRDRARIAALSPALQSSNRFFCSPDAAARRTDQVLGGNGLSVNNLRDIDYGKWSGQSLASVSSDDPASFNAWLTDASSAPHGGESVLDLCCRVGNWLDNEARKPGRVRVTCPPNSIRAAIVYCLSTQAEAFLRLDIAPLSITQLSFHNGQWRVQIAGPHVSLALTKADASSQH